MLHARPVAALVSALHGETGRMCRSPIYLQSGSLPTPSLQVDNVEFLNLRELQLPRSLQQLELFVWWVVVRAQTGAAMWWHRQPALALAYAGTAGPSPR